MGLSVEVYYYLSYCELRHCLDKPPFPGPETGLLTADTKLKHPPPRIHPPTVSASQKRASVFLFLRKRISTEMSPEVINNSFPLTFGKD